MSEERARRVGHNQTLYREVNERVAKLSEPLATTTDDFGVVCECGDLECSEEISVSRTAYERVRASAERFILKRGHEAPDLEQAVEDNADYVVVTKRAGTPTRIAEQADPRR